MPLADHTAVDWRDALLAAEGESAYAIRTASWCLRESGTATEENVGSDPSQQSSCELFVRPDDRWEANDVFKLCPEIVEELRSAIARSDP